MGQPNLFDPEFDSESDRDGFSGRRAKLGERAGGSRLGASLYELAPGSAAFPFHYHLGNEELLIVISGTPVLRAPAGDRRLETGEVVAFPIGEEGAHQVVNRDSEPARILIVSEMNAPDVVVRPESGKLSAFGRAPGSSEAGLHEAFFLTDATEFWDGEDAPPPPGSASGR
jgi:uncharacterized cupin superfamily protein